VSSRVSTNDVRGDGRRAGARGGFAVRTLTGTAATRRGILEAYRGFHQRHRLRRRLRGSTTAAHGGLLRPPDDAPPPADDPLGAGRPDLQFIVPADYHDFARSRTSAASPGWSCRRCWTRLTGVTANATVVLDCCHSAHMSRLTGLRLKALLHRPEAGTHVDVRQRPAPRRAPRAARAVTCTATPRAVAGGGLRRRHESAWGGRQPPPRHHGACSPTPLARILTETRDLRVNWPDAAGRGCAARCRTSRPPQRPRGRGAVDPAAVRGRGAVPLGDPPRRGGPNPGRIRLARRAAHRGAGPATSFANHARRGGGRGATASPSGTARVTGLVPMAAAADLNPGPGAAPKCPRTPAPHQTLAARAAAAGAAAGPPGRRRTCAPRMAVRALAAARGARPTPPRSPSRPASPGSSCTTRAGPAGTHRTRRRRPASTRSWPTCCASPRPTDAAPARAGGGRTRPSSADVRRRSGGLARGGRPEPLPAGRRAHPRHRRGAPLRGGAQRRRRRGVLLADRRRGSRTASACSPPRTPAGGASRPRSGFVYGWNEDTGRLDGRRRGAGPPASTPAQAAAGDPAGRHQRRPRST